MIKLPLQAILISVALMLMSFVVASYGVAYQYTLVALGVIIATLVGYKLLKDPSSIEKIYASRDPLALIPSFAITILLLSYYVALISPYLGRIIWFMTVIIYFGYIIVYTKRYMLHISVVNIAPSDMIVYCGIASAGVASRIFGLEQFGQVTFWVGFLMYLILIIPLIRGVRAHKTGFGHSVIYLVAPPGILIAGYIHSFTFETAGIIDFVGILLLFSLGYLFYKTFSLIKLPFNSDLAALSVPYATSSLGIYTINQQLIARDITIPFMTYLHIFLLVWTFYVVFYTLSKLGKEALSKDAPLKKSSRTKKKPRTS